MKIKVVSIGKVEIRHWFLLHVDHKATILLDVVDEDVI
jgi:hypothetical protein